MKCDDDTFVRVDAVMKEAKKVPQGRNLYVGNINYYHKPLRQGKWAVTYEVLLGLFALRLSHPSPLLTAPLIFFLFGTCMGSMPSPIRSNLKVVSLKCQT